MRAEGGDKKGGFFGAVDRAAPSPCPLPASCRCKSNYFGRHQCDATLVLGTVCFERLSADFAAKTIQEGTQRISREAAPGSKQAAAGGTQSTRRGGRGEAGTGALQLPAEE